RFTDLLLRYRGRSGLTQRQLATRVGASVRAIQGWETGDAYPETRRLQALIAALLEAGALTPGNELEEAEQMWHAVMLAAPHSHPPFEHDWFRSLTGAHAVVTAPDTNERVHDWGDAPGVLDFVGRAEELSRAGSWMLDERCRLVGVFGMGGIGKTTIAAK